MNLLLIAIIIVGLYIMRNRNKTDETPKRIVEYAVSLEELLNPKYKTNKRYDLEGFHLFAEVGLSFVSIFEEFDEVRIWIDEEYLPNIVKAVCNISGPHSKIVFSINLDELIKNKGCVEFDPNNHALFVLWVAIDEKGDLINNRRLINNLIEEDQD
jgi:hypothetical protein